METENKPKGKRGGANRKPTGNIWTRTTMTMKPSQWEEIKKASVIYGRNCSRWAFEIAKNYEGVPPISSVGDGEHSKIYPFCFTSQELKELADIAEAKGMNRSKYFVNCVLDFLEKHKI